MLETKRLLLRKFTSDDFQPLLHHRSDKDVMKYVGGTQSPEKIKEKLNLYSDFYKKNGYAFCAMIWRETDEFIGVGGLQQSEPSFETEVGYTVDKKFWGRGIATECTLGCLEFGFNKINLEKIIALTHSQNIGSIRVLEKAGMKFDKEVKNNNQNWFKYKLLKEEYVGN